FGRLPNLDPYGRHLSLIEYYLIDIVLVAASAILLNTHLPEYNHLDFIWGVQAAADFYKPIVSYIKDSLAQQTTGKWSEANSLLSFAIRDLLCFRAAGATFFTMVWRSAPFAAIVFLWKRNSMAIAVAVSLKDYASTVNRISDRMAARIDTKEGRWTVLSVYLRRPEALIMKGRDLRDFGRCREAIPENDYLFIADDLNGRQ
ncbi:hypothetical protein TELCIR_03804, partial [Teladorsagia circumcincta]